MLLKQNGNNLAVFSFLILIFCSLLLTSCTGADEWCYDKLPNGYAVWKCNAEDITLGINDSEFSSITVIERYVSEFCYNDRYIGIKRIDIGKHGSLKKPVNIENIDMSNPEYFLVDSKTQRIYGRLTEKEYVSMLIELNINDMCDWISTKTQPK